MTCPSASSSSSKGPGILASAGCWESASHTAAWGSYVEQCEVETIADTGSSAKHSATIMYNDRGDELEVKRIIHWNIGQRFIYVLCYDSSRAPSTRVA